MKNIVFKPYLAILRPQIYEFPMFLQLRSPYELRRFASALTVFVLLLGISRSTASRPVDISWNPSDPAENVTSYRIFLETSPQVWSMIEEVPASGTTEATVDLPDGSQTIAMTALNPYLESELSASLVVPANVSAITFANLASAQSLSGAEAQPVPDGNGSGGNPDGDARANLLEHAFADDLLSGARASAGFQVREFDPAQGIIEVAFVRPEAISDVIYVLEARDTLVGDGPDGLGWFPVATIPAGGALPSPMTSSSNGDGTETVVFPDLTSNVAALAAGFGLVRISVSLDADRDGIADALPSDGTVVTGHTKTLGWQESSLNSQQSVSLNSPFVNQSVFSGVVDSVSGDTLDVSGSAGAVDLRTVIPADGSHYLQITDGVLEGERFDIGGVGVSNLVLLNDPDIFSGSDGVTTLNTSDGLPTNAELAGSSFLVIPHRTLDQLFDKNTAFAGEAHSDPNLASGILLFDNRQDLPRFEFLVLLDYTTEVKWVSSSDIGSRLDQGSRALTIGSGVFLNPRQGSVDVIDIGVIADYDVAVALNEGYNSVAAPYPMDQTPAGPNGRGYTVANGFPGGIDPQQATGLLLWAGDTAADAGAAYAPAYKSYMLLDASGLRFWSDLNQATLPNLDDGLVLESHRSSMLVLPAGTSLRPHIYQKPATQE
ncbi:MAG: hypothetical protein HKN82_02305 [Akkermansiaceae bacterium]|nr:hypothetical protein [Akkermansiaceae bacterium]